MTTKRSSPSYGAIVTGAQRAKATNLRPNTSTDNRPKVIYQAPDQDTLTQVPLGARELELVRALDGKPLTRVELARIRPRLKLNATGTVSRLRRKGIQIESIWHELTDAEGRSVRFLSYSLTGRVSEVAL